MASYSDSEGEDESLALNKTVPRFRNVYNYTKVKAKIHLSQQLAPLAKIDNSVTISQDVTLRFQKNLSSQLKKDADFLVGKAMGDKNVVVCAVLKKQSTSADGKESVGKKFVFTNFFEYEGHHANFKKQLEFVQAAHAMGYHVVQAQQSHAGMAVLQFLEERCHVYDPIPIAMGCNNHVCKLCSELLDIMWGPDWHKWFNYMDKSSRNHFHWYTPRALINIIMKEPKKTKGFREKYATLIPDYAEHWVENAPDYIGCTDGVKLPLWECSRKDLCWTHGPTLYRNQAPRPLKDPRSCSARRIENMVFSKNPPEQEAPQRVFFNHPLLSCVPEQLQDNYDVHAPSPTPPVPNGYAGLNFNNGHATQPKRSNGQMWGYVHQYPPPVCHGLSYNSGDSTNNNNNNNGSILDHVLTNFFGVRRGEGHVNQAVEGLVDHFGNININGDNNGHPSRGMNGRGGPLGYY